jgi:ATP-dependent RNA helicase RhlE
LTKVGLLVLDEVDRMLDMGFAPQLMQVVPYLPANCQTLLFSATLPKEIQPVVSSYLKDPVRVSIGATTQPHDRVKQENHSTTHLNKNDLLLKHLAARKGKVIIFARTQRRANKVLNVLQRNRLPAALLHGGRSQGQRKEALDGFRSGTHRFLVATDVAGRGIDVSDVECVINYDLPVCREDYIHRIGRTARNGKTGSALNYLTPDDREGKGILSPPEAPRGKTHPALPKGNNPGSQKGGWETRGGRNKPIFRKRSAAEGYGKDFDPSRKPKLKSSGGAKPRSPQAGPKRNAQEQARARKLGIAGNSKAAQSQRAVLPGRRR